MLFFVSRLVPLSHAMNSNNNDDDGDDNDSNKLLKLLLSNSFD